MVVKVTHLEVTPHSHSVFYTIHCPLLWNTYKYKYKSSYIKPFNLVFTPYFTSGLLSENFYLRLDAIFCVTTNM